MHTKYSSYNFFYPIAFLPATIYFNIKYANFESTIGWCFNFLHILDQLTRPNPSAKVQRPRWRRGWGFGAQIFSTEVRVCVWVVDSRESK